MLIVKASFTVHRKENGTRVKAGSQKSPLTKNSRITCHRRSKKKPKPKTNMAPIKETGLEYVKHVIIGKKSDSFDSL